MQQRNILKFCSKFNQYTTWRRRTSLFVANYTKDTLSLIWCMDRNRFIQTFHCTFNVVINDFHTSTTSYTLKVYPLFYSNFPLSTYLSLRSQKKQFFTFSLRDITKFQKSTKNLITPLLVLQTNLGMATQTEAAEMSRGGTLLGILYRFSR